MRTHRAALGILLIASALDGAGVRASQQPDTVGSRFKNIQVLTDLKEAPAQQLFDVMQFMSGSLSVSCDFCHASQNGPFDSDANARKPIARDMIRMTRAINASSFEGKPVVTCNTCHQGTPRPPATPTPWHKSTEAIARYKESTRSGGTQASAASSAVSAPGVEQILDRYRKAVNADGVKSLRVAGTNVIAMSGAEIPFTAEAIFPDRMALTTRQASETRTVLVGSLGWRRTPQATTDLGSGQVASTTVLLNLVLRPLKYDGSSGERKWAGTASVDGVLCDVVESQAPGGTERVYFDRQTGLLKEIRREISTPFGTNVEERLLTDYRAAAGVLLPRLITNHYMEDQSEFRIAAVEVNPAIDPATFERGS